jgi:hypothetical protein
VIVSVFLMDNFTTIRRKQKVSDDVYFSDQGTANLHETPCSPNSTGSTANLTLTSSMSEELGPIVPQLRNHNLQGVSRL